MRSSRYMVRLGRRGHTDDRRRTAPATFSVPHHLIYGRHRPVVGLGPVVVGTVSRMEHATMDRSHTALLAYETSIGSQCDQPLPARNTHSSLAPRQHHQGVCRCARAGHVTYVRHLGDGDEHVGTPATWILSPWSWIASTAANSSRRWRRGWLYVLRPAASCGLHAWPDRPAPARRASEPLIG